MKNKAIQAFLRFRATLLTTAVEGIKPIYAVVFQRDKTPWEVSLPQLRRMPPDSLGASLADFLDTHGFSLLPLYENHDVYHVLLAFNATVEDEAAMQFWLLGNRKYTPSVLVTVAFSLLLLPEFSHHFFRAYQRGKRAVPIKSWDFQQLLHLPLIHLQNQLKQG